MKLQRILKIFQKDLALGPRSPLIIFAVFMPLAITLVIQLVFGTLLTPQPRLAIYDEGRSQLTELVTELPNIRVSILESKEQLLQEVKAHDHDAGLILQSDFDTLVQSGQKPELQLYFSGESYAMNRLTLAVSTIDMIRTVEGSSSLVDIQLVRLSEKEPLPLSVRLTPFVVVYAFIIAGLFIPAASIVEEKERRTIVAVTSTPASIQDFVAAKALLGILLAMILALVSLILNNAVPGSYPVLILVLLIVSVFWSMLGILVGLIAKNSEMLFAIVKSSGALLMGPVVFYIFPAWPQWIARIFPTYWAIDPLWQLMANNASLEDLFIPLAIVIGICIALIPLLNILSKRTVKNLG